MIISISYLTRKNFTNDYSDFIMEDSGRKEVLTLAKTKPLFYTEHRLRIFLMAEKLYLHLLKEGKSFLHNNHLYVIGSGHGVGLEKASDEVVRNCEYEDVFIKSIKVFDIVENKVSSKKTSHSK